MSRDAIGCRSQTPASSRSPLPAVQMKSTMPMLRWRRIQQRAQSQRHADKTSYTTISVLYTILCTRHDRASTLSIVSGAFINHSNAVHSADSRRICPVQLDLPPPRMFTCIIHVQFCSNFPRVSCRWCVHSSVSARLLALLSSLRLRFSVNARLRSG